MKPFFTASMMCASYGCLENEVRNLQIAGIDSFHIDIMDGEFVDNFGMGYQDMEFIRNSTNLELDVHLMVNRPSTYIPFLYDLGVDAIYIHPEADKDPASTIEKLQNHGISAGLAINPGTALETVSYMLNVVDRVLILGVNPGHAGRQYQTYVDHKISELLQVREKKLKKFQILLDGAVTKARIIQWYPKGVEGFVLGTSALFTKGETSYKEKIDDLYRSIE